MTVNDGGLIERARKRKIQAKVMRGAAPKAAPGVDELWKELQRETLRQAKVYTDALGDAGGLVVGTAANSIELSVPGGPSLTLRADLDNQRMFETFRNRAGAVRTRRPIIKFSRDAEGELTFNFGGVQSAAASLLRQVID